MAEAPVMKLKDVTIYTDGGAMPNPGRGGYGVVLRFGEHCKELSGGYELTTNNRMELMAVIAGLEALKTKCRVKLHSDSRYIVDAVTSGAVFKWRANDWAMNVSRSKLAKNHDLWERLLLAYDQHEVEMIWVKGHAGIDDNERCDQLALAAIKQENLLPDQGYQPHLPPYSDAFNTATSGNHSQTNTKMTEAGQPCRKCQTPVVKQIPRKKSVKPNQTYYFSWYLYCPGCKAMYMVEEAKREVNGESSRLFDE
jgi:ribonuclease HI